MLSKNVEFCGPEVVNKMSENSNDIVSAAALIIGDEILCGRTTDKNSATIARFCAGRGIALEQVRVVADNKADIVEALNALRKKYTYVFVTGGIGPTHDDITADAVAAAFGVGLALDQQALAMMEEKYGKRDVSPARLRMARVPEGAGLIKNPLTGAPGFRLENVFVMAGVPQIMQGMLAQIAPQLKGGRIVHSVTIPVGVGESIIARGLEQVQNEYDGVKIGSYPRLGEKSFFGEVVLRGSDKVMLEEAAAKVRLLIDRAHKERGVELTGKKHTSQGSL